MVLKHKSVSEIWSHSGREVVGVALAIGVLSSCGTASHNDVKTSDSAARWNVAMILELADLARNDASIDFIFLCGEAAVAEENALKQGRRNGALRVVRSKQAVLTSSIRKMELARQDLLKYLPRTQGITEDQRKKLLLCAASEAALIKAYVQEAQLLQRYARTGDEALFFRSQSLALRSGDASMQACKSER